MEDITASANFFWADEALSTHMKILQQETYWEKAHRRENNQKSLFK